MVLDASCLEAVLGTVPHTGCFYELGSYFVGVLIMLARALLLGVHVRALLRGVHARALLFGVSVRNPRIHTSPSQAAAFSGSPIFGNRHCSSSLGKAWPRA